MRWRLARAAGTPADRRFDHGGRAMKGESFSLFAVALLVFISIGAMPLFGVAS
jgi:hypothetical protein